MIIIHAIRGNKSWYSFLDGVSKFMRMMVHITGERCCNLLQTRIGKLLEVLMIPRIFTAVSRIKNIAKIRL